MSSGDYLRYLRALVGGPDFREVSSKSGVPIPILRQIEQRYRPIGDEETLRKLADYYGVPADEVLWRHRWSRRALTFFLQDRVGDRAPARFEMATGDTLEGVVRWYDLGAFLLETPDGEIVVQRHMVERWSEVGKPFTPPPPGT